MNDDLNDVLGKFSDILKEKNIDINNILNNEQTSSYENNDLNLDINTVLKIKEVISKINKNQNSPRNKLLQSLKPFLEVQKQEKLDNYIKIANLLNILEDLDSNFSFLNNQKGYDFILIITLFLLIL